MEAFSNRLREAMQDLNINLTKLSNLTNISKPLISNYLSGNYKAKQDNIYILAKALNVSPSWLMGFDVDKDAEWIPGKDKIDDETYKIYDKNQPIDKLDVLYSKSKDFLSDDDRTTLEFIMQKTIDNYNKTKNN